MGVAVPSGWTSLVNGLSINSSTSGGARLFVFYRRVTASEPDTYTWTTSSAVKWGGGMTAYRGVDPVTPLSAGPVTAVDASYLATSITLPSLTTAVSGSMLIGGVALDAATPGVSQPPGWAEDWEAAGGQIAEQASRGQSSAGPTGSVTWSWGPPRAAGGWFAALRPAS
jgi:hypothetical protein